MSKNFFMYVYPAVNGECREMHIVDVLVERLKLQKVYLDLSGRAEDMSKNMAEIFSLTLHNSVRSLMTEVKDGYHYLAENIRLLGILTKMFSSGSLQTSQQEAMVSTISRTIKIISNLAYAGDLAQSV